MAHHRIKFIIVVHFFLLISYFSPCASVEGRKISTQNTQKHKNAIKTIQTENGDIVDCVRLYNQPALNHPLLKNHKIQMRPSWYPERMRKDAFEGENSETHAQLEIVHCPEGTIPILRNPKSISQLKPNATANLFSPGIQDAYFWLNGRGAYTGTDSYINVWSPRVASSQEHSGVYTWVQAVNQEQGNIELAGAGWMVNPGLYDNKPRLAVYWTRDNFQRTGCWNTFCDGYVHVNRYVHLAISLNPSRYGGHQESIRIMIYKDQYSGNWWVQFMNYSLGYWPKVLFSETGLGFGAAYLSWGGKVLNSGEFPGQTYTEMGSGHVPNEGFGKACYVRNLNVFQGFNFLVPVQVNDLQAQITNSACYNAIKGYYGAFGTTIYLGGNGASSPYCRL